MIRWLLAFTLASTSAWPHEKWANGDPIPPGIKAMCCGPADAHHMQQEQVHKVAGGWFVDGYKALIPDGTELPSPDGSFWIFYRDMSDGKQSKVYCFFVPIPAM